MIIQFVDGQAVEGGKPDIGKVKEWAEFFADGFPAGFLFLHQFHFCAGGFFNLEIFGDGGLNGLRQFHAEVERDLLALRFAGKRKVSHFIRVCPKQRITRPQMVVEKIQWFIGCDARQPKRKFGEFNGKRIHVHAVNARFHNAASPVGNFRLLL